MPESQAVIDHKPTCAWRLGVSPEGWQPVQVEDEGRLVAAQANNAVVVEILQALGLAEVIEIRVRGIGMVVDGEQAPLDQIRLNRTPEPDRKIGLAHGKVEIVVGQDQLHVDLRVEVEEFRDAVGEPDATNPDGGRDLEIADGPFTGFGEPLTRHLHDGACRALPGTAHRHARSG